MFTNTLAAGAFTSTALYSFASLDSLGVAPTVKAALVVSGSASVVELVLSDDLVQGGKYTVTATGVPAIDSSVTAPPCTEPFTYGVTPSALANREPAQSNTNTALYGIDLIWSGADFQETPAGDLARIGGATNAIAAVARRLRYDGLPWDPTYGPNARGYVDGTAGSMPTLRGALMQQAMADDRVASVTVTLQTQDDATFFEITPVLVGNQPVAPISVVVPTS